MRKMIQISPGETRVTRIFVHLIMTKCICLINYCVIYAHSHIHTWLTGFIANDCLCFFMKNCVLCVLMFMYYTVCYFTGIFYAVIRL